MKEKGVHENKCLLDFLLDISNENFTEEDCINEAGTFMLAVSKFLMRKKNFFKKMMSSFSLLKGTRFCCKYDRLLPSSDSQQFRSSGNLIQNFILLQ